MIKLPVGISTFGSLGDVLQLTLRGVEVCDLFQLDEVGDIEVGRGQFVQDAVREISARAASSKHYRASLPSEMLEDHGKDARCPS